MSQVISLIEGSVIVADDDLFAEGRIANYDGVVSVLISFGGDEPASWLWTQRAGAAGGPTSVVGELKGSEKRATVREILRTLTVTV